MYVYVLEFENHEALSRPFARLFDASFVENRSTETETLRIRFASPKKADALLERIYLDGGLRWCSLHRVGAAGASL